MTSLYLNMFGYDDDDLNQECMRCAQDPTVNIMITLDKSQSNSVMRKRSSRPTGEAAWISPHVLGDRAQFIIYRST